MPPRNVDLHKDWKVPLNAELAGKIEFALSDPVTRAPRYGARKRLIEELLSWWLAREAGSPIEDLPSVATLEQLRSM